MKEHKRILVCPLDWGLGHATRCIPIIYALLNEGAQVLIAADGAPLALLKEEFPQLKFISLPGYNIHYSKRMTMTVSMFLQSPKILFNILAEHKRLKKIIRDHSIDCVIADNRYGLWSKKVYTVFITHQLLIKCPLSLKFLEPLLRRFNYFFINKFNECWIPDEESGNNLSGELSHTIPMPESASFIGWLSRFDSSIKNDAPKKYDLLAVISGPEPHHALLVDKIQEQLKHTNLTSLVVSGEPDKKYDHRINENIRIVSHLNAGAMSETIEQSEVVICRAGYSSIMDLTTLKKKAILIPTPGQTEQEYLAKYLKTKKMFYAVSQKELDLGTALKELNSFGDFSKIDAKSKYAYVKELIEKIN